MARDGLEVAIGVRGLLLRFESIRTEVRKETTQDMDDIALDLLQRAQDLAPILTGDLIASGTINRRGGRKELVSRRVEFGTDHAVFAHEAITPAGPYNLGPLSSEKPPSVDGPIGGHFLKRPYQLHKGRYVDRLGKAVRRSLDGAVKRRIGSQVTRIVSVITGRG